MIMEVCAELISRKKTSETEKPELFARLASTCVYLIEILVNNDLDDKEIKSTKKCKHFDIIL